MMNKARKRILCILVFLIVAANAYSSYEVWYGGAFVGNRNFLSSGSQQYYKPMLDNLGISGEMKYVRRIGLDLEMVVFPSPDFRIGPYIAAEFLFPVGYSATGGDGGYLSRNFDRRSTLKLGLSYYKIFTRFGFFTDVGMNLSVNRIATTNEKNHKGPVEYMTFGEYGYFADMGILAKAENSYFKLGCAFAQELNYSSFVFDIALFATFGFIID